ncbi:hypothetical protein [Streptacidiphilus jiangxiensis]|uniref:Uncharacterized protein n=1 Tax=Streptacidiphilus jiangxiensis TaxID=235985 RepID=A0A1H7QLB8_STRJI|nr:hypothetical protein [Streptacidiphilus jiangxiensis]SEL48703.1 hypothetical protein SAMN05414137_10990 [Streptacidiphilus jiangxiensis]
MTVLEHESVQGIDGGVDLGDGWALRLGQGSRGRVALEVYAGETLLDVMVEGALTAELLRGARRAAPPGGAVLAWGLLPSDGPTPLVRFGRGTAQPVLARIVAGRFWVALGDASADRVAAAARAGAPWQELRVSPVR